MEYESHSMDGFHHMGMSPTESGLDADDHMSDIKLIVESLNEPPFNKDLSLVEFDARRPLEILQIVNDIFATFDPKHKKDLRDEKEDQMATRMLEFLMILNYRVNNQDVMNPEFREPFLEGDRRVLYPLLVWLLSNQHTLSKRAYLARFLRNVEVPEENFADHHVVSLYQQYKELQEEFKTSHRMIEKLRKGSVDPTQIKSELAQLDLERNQLKTILQRLNNKVKNGQEYQDVDFKHVLAQTHALREQQEEEHRLMEQLDEQKRELMRNQQRRVQAKIKLDEQTLKMTNPQDLMEDIKREVEIQKERLASELPMQIEAQKTKLNELQSILTETPMTEGDVHKLEEEIGDMEDKVQKLTEERDRAAAAQNTKVGFYRDQANAQVAKRDKLKDVLEEILEDKREYEAETRHLSQELATYFDGKDRPKTEAEMQKYMLDLQAKSKKYKVLAEKLMTLKREVATLARTEEVLRSKHANIREFNKEMEKEHGLHGYQDTKDKLEAVSSNKASVDAEKEATLAQVSELVKRIRKTLQEKKGTMGPQIKRLREVRREFNDIQQEYETKKALHNNTYAGLRAERLKLEQDVERNMKAIHDEETSYHIFHSQAMVNEGRLKMLVDEKSFLKGDDRLGQEGCKSYQQLLAKSIDMVQIDAKKLRIEQKNIKTTHPEKLEQRRMFENLQKIMALKHKLTVEAKQKQENEKDIEGTNFMQIADDLADTGLGERMVING